MAQVTILDRLNALSEEAFVAAKWRLARESALADREGGEPDSSSGNYWHGWLDNMDRVEFAGEIDIGEAAYTDYMIDGD